MVLVYSDDSVRIVVSTANLVPSDWENRTQGLWVSPKCPASPEGQTPKDSVTGKSLLEALIFASTHPQYVHTFIDLPVQYMKTKSSEHIVYIIVLNVKIKTKNNLCTQHVL